jgi:aminoglycoside 6'-N-acetyltransferase I
MADGGTDPAAAGEALVREAGPADGDGMIELLDQLGYPTAAATFAARYERLRDDAAAWIFVAERDRRVVGFASLYVIPLLEREPMGRLTALVVSEEARGRGIGRALVERVQEEAQRQGCDQLEVTSGLWRREAHAFYASVGFQKASRRFMMALE